MVVQIPIPVSVAPNTVLTLPVLLDVERKSKGRTLPCIECAVYMLESSRGLELENVLSEDSCILPKNRNGTSSISGSYPNSKIFGLQLIDTLFIFA